VKLRVVLFQAGAARYFAPVTDYLAAHHGVEVSFYGTAVARDALMPRACDLVPDDIYGLAKGCDILCVSATGDPREGALVREAKSQGTPSIQAIDTAYNYAQRFAPDCEWPARLLVINQRAADEAHEEGVPKSLMLPTGHPAWEAARSLAPARPGTVLFIDQPLLQLLGPQSDVSETASFTALRSVCAHSNGRWMPPMVCLHPERRGASPYNASCVSAQEGMRLAELVVGIHSSLMVDAFVGGRSVVSVQLGAPTMNRDLLSRWGLVPLASSEDGLPAAIEAASLARKGQINPFLGSTERTAQAILSCARE
jgi:hypothetical protein